VVLDHFLRTFDHRVAIAFAYCDYRDSSPQIPRDILKVSFDSWWSGRVVFLSSDTMLRKCKEGLRKLHPEELVEILSSLLASFERQVLVIDALDECEGCSVL
jgi:hypothetical protein